MFEMARELAQTADEAEQQAELGALKFMQCRLPVTLYEWLRLKAFVRRISMNSIVLQAITEMQAAWPDVDSPASVPVTQGTSGGVKFNVRVSETRYEWLRTKAFYSHGSINQLLITAL